MFAWPASMEPWVCPVSPEGAFAVDTYWEEARWEREASPPVASGPVGAPVSGVAPVGASGLAPSRRRETLLFPRHAEPADPEDELAFDFF